MATDAALVERWRQLVHEHGRSGLSQEAFCRERGISRKSLSRWRGQLREELEFGTVPGVVELVLDERGELPVRDSDIELLVGGDCSLFFAAGTPPGYIAELVVALRACGAC